MLPPLSEGPGSFYLYLRTLSVRLMITSAEYAKMPYQSIMDLPELVKTHLPQYAQVLFRAAYNNALQVFGNEESATRLAWNAVARDYEPNEDGTWRRKRALP